MVPGSHLRVYVLLALVALAGIGAATLAGADAPAPASSPYTATPLTGPWTLRSDPSDRGRALGWQRGGFAGSTVAVPFVPNAGRITGAAGVRSHHGSLAWWSTTFSVPVDGHYAIDFESVNHKAEVWVDGRLLGRHIGEFLPFTERFHAAAGRHTLVVRSDYRDPQAMKAAGWHRTWFNFGGINRGVALRRLGDSELSAPTVVTHLTRDGAAEVDVTVHVHNLARGTRDIGVQGTLSRAGERTELSFGVVGAPAGRWVVARAHVRIADPALWSPGSPALYRLALKVPGESQWSGQTGLRELRRRGTSLLLNGRPLLLHGASLNEDVPGHGDALSPADMDALVAELKAIGANATRSQHPLTPALLDRLDAAGIMVWQGIGPVDAPGAWTATTAARRRSARERALTSWRQLQIHPSIVVWSLANEVAGHGHTGGQAQYIDGLARELHRRDPGRLVAVDVWGSHPPADDRSLLYRDLDAVGLTNYAGWYDSTRASRTELASIVRARLAAFHRAFPDKVTAITEFGAEASAANPSDEPGGYSFQTALLATHLRAYRDDPRLSGMLVWVLRDFAVAPSFAGGSIHRQVPDIQLVRGLNQKGLFDYAGDPKPAVSVVRSVFERVPDYRGG